MKPHEVVAFLNHCSINAPHVGDRVRLAAHSGVQWAKEALGDGWTGPERRRLEAASGAAAAELQIICELHSAKMGTRL